MSKKPATLSANLVAVKGAAAPTRPAPELPPVGPGETGGQPLNFRVSEAFRREFKVCAARRGLKLNELLRLSFESYRCQYGD